VHNYVLNIVYGKLARIFVRCYSNGNVTLIAFLCNASIEFAAEGKALGAVQTMGFTHSCIALFLRYGEDPYNSDAPVYQEYYASERKL
jgi:hypothetical protein